MLKISEQVDEWRHGQRLKNWLIFFIRFLGGWWLGIRLVLILNLNYSKKGWYYGRYANAGSNKVGHDFLLKIFKYFFQLLSILFSHE